MYDNFSCNCSFSADFCIFCPAGRQSSSDNSHHYYNYDDDDDYDSDYDYSYESESKSRHEQNYTASYDDGYHDYFTGDETYDRELEDRLYNMPPDELKREDPDLYDYAYN